MGEDQPTLIPVAASPRHRPTHAVQVIGDGALFLIYRLAPSGDMHFIAERVDRAAAMDYARLLSRLEQIDRERGSGERVVDDTDDPL